MCNPRPIPFVFNYYVDSKKPNNLNNFYWSFYLIPMPVSSTIISTTPYLAFSTILIKFCSSGYDKSVFWFNIFPLTLTKPPLLVNLSELDIRFRSI